MLWNKFLDYLDKYMMIKEIVSVYADKLYDGISIQEYLKKRNIITPVFRLERIANHQKSNHTRNIIQFGMQQNDSLIGWLKNGFHRTRICYEKSCDNYLRFVYLASIMMYQKVLE